MYYFLHFRRKNKWIAFDPPDFNLERSLNLLRLNANDTENRLAGFDGFRVVRNDGIVVAGIYG